VANVFRLSKRHLYIGSGCLGLFIGAIALSCIFYLVGEIPLVVLIITGCVLGLMALGSLWIILAYFRESLTFDGQTLTQRGVFFSSTVWLPDVTDARWIVSPEGAVVLRSPLGKLKIYLGNFERHERLLLIRLLRAVLRGSAHRDWPAFCLRVALPLRRHLEWLDSESQPLEPSEIIITRRRLDIYFAVGTVLAASVGVFSWWTTGNIRVLAAPGVMLVLWVSTRLRVPKRGMRSHRISVDAKHKSPMLIWVSVLAALPLCVVAIRWGLPRPLGDGVMIALGVVLLALMLVCCYREDRRRAQQGIEAAPAAVEEWELGEPPCPSPANPKAG